MSNGVATAFTPGPWAYRPNEHDDWGVVRGPDGWIIVQAGAGRDVSEDEKAEHRRRGTDPYEANARLIAAAPEMYEALAEVRSQLADLLSANIRLEQRARDAEATAKAMVWPSLPTVGDTRTWDGLQWPRDRARLCGCQ